MDRAPVQPEVADAAVLAAKDQIASAMEIDALAPSLMIEDQRDRLQNSLEESQWEQERLENEVIRPL
ncbi:hypothetical protein R1flu_023024 [Riccia fluitans]|uniref:Uncharacterized protein n=1 Tax=Riccia fluitans TaxID=41844 RepID=A0ABD1XQU9_9MARC